MKRIATLLLAAGMVLSSVAGAGAVDIKVKGSWLFDYSWSNNRDFNTLRPENGSDTRRDGEIVAYDGPEHRSYQSFNANQRFRTQIDFIASESLRGVLAFDVGSTTGAWGHGRDTFNRGGFDLWGNAAVRVRNAYVDWIVPQTELKFRMGLQSFALPTAVTGGVGSGNAVFDDRAAGILASYQFNDYVGVNLGWFRPYNDGQDIVNYNEDLYGAAYNGVPHANIDMFALTVPLTFDGFDITPWGMYANIGNGGNDGNPNMGWWYGPHLSGSGIQLGDNGKAWWTGLAFNMTYFDPFEFGLDFTYGSYSSKDVGRWDGVNGVRDDSLETRTWDDYLDLDPNSPFFGQDYQAYTEYTGLRTKNNRSGWAIATRLAYKLDMMTPAIYAWYGSGAKRPKILDGFYDDVDNDGDLDFVPTRIQGSLDGLMPSISPFWGFGSYGGVNNYSGLAPQARLTGGQIAGTWGLGIGLEDISFIEDLTHQFRVLYYRGTNHKDWGRAAWFGTASDVLQPANNMGSYTGQRLTTKDHAWEVNLDTEYKIYENLSLYNQIGMIAPKLHYVDKEKPSYVFGVGFNYSF